MKGAFLKVTKSFIESGFGYIVETVIQITINQSIENSSISFILNKILLAKIVEIS